MKRATQCGLLLAVLGCSAANVCADAGGDYKVILDRNPFGLKPAPLPPPPQTNAPPETPTKFKLSGLTALFKPPRAMFVNEGVPGKPEYISLPEGQGGGGILVLSNGINFAAGTVRVIIAGEERTLSFEKDGVKPAVGSPLMPAPGGAPARFTGGYNPQPATLGGTTISQPSAVPVNFNQIPSGVSPQGGAGAIPPPAITPNTARIPRFGQATEVVPIVVPFANAGNQTSPPPAPPVDPVVQAVTMEVQRAATKKQVDAGQLPPLPPTDLSGR